jgi:hypothetical protein
LAIAFAYVFNHILIIPVGQVFSSRSAPSFYCLSVDVRQALAATLPIATMENLNPLVKQCELHISKDSPVIEVPPDSHHPPLTPNEFASPYHKSFVDDTGVAAYVKNMLQTLNNSVVSAFGFFGAQGTNRRGDCLQDSKWLVTIHEAFVFLGFLICTHTMTIS